MTGKARAPRFDGDRVAVLEDAHVQLAGRDRLLWAVGDAVDHQPAHAADALATVVVEGHRLLVAVDQLLVEQVEHLQK
jgi:hypothetical protein